MHASMSFQFTKTDENTWLNTSPFFWSSLINSLVAGSSKIYESVEESVLFLLTYFQNFFGHPRMLAMIDDSSDFWLTLRNRLARCQALLCTHHEYSFFFFFYIYHLYCAHTTSIRFFFNIYHLHCSFLSLIASITNFGRRQILVQRGMNLSQASFTISWINSKAKSTSALLDWSSSTIEIEQIKSWISS